MARNFGNHKGHMIDLDEAARDRDRLHELATEANLLTADLHGLIIAIIDAKEELAELKMDSRVATGFGAMFNVAERLCDDILTLVDRMEIATARHTNAHNS